MKKTYIIIVVLVLIAVALFFVLRSKKLEAPTVNNDTAQTTKMPVMAGMPIPADYNAPVGDASAPLKEFTVTGQNFSFTPASLSVKKGDRVKITFKNAKGFHDFRLDGFKVATTQIKTDEEASVEFIADKTGSFEYYCSVGSHRAMGMVGTLTVE